MIPLVTDTLRGRRVGAIVLTAALAALSVGYLAMFPALEEQLQAFAGDIPEFYDALVGDADFTTPDGYVRTQVFALLAPLLAAGVAISAATGLARAERDVTLTPTFVAPVSRATLATSYLAVAWLIGLAGGLAVFVGVMLGAPLAGAEVGLDGIAAATVPFVGFAWAASSVAWAAGAATGSPGVAMGSGWGFVSLSFLANSFGEVIEDLSLLTDVSPWGWYGAGKAITEGFDPVSLLLFVVAFALVPVGVTAFTRRDLQL